MKPDELEDWFCCPSAMQAEEELNEERDLLERMAKELKNWVDPMIDMYIHQNSLGTNCGCYQCVWKRSKVLVDEFYKPNDSGEN